MHWDDVKMYFTYLQICHINKDYYHSSIKCEHPNQGFSMVKFEVPSSGKVNISVLQQDKRIPSKLADYAYASVRASVVKIIEEKSN